MSEQRCRHCPVAPGLRCRGQVAPRLCQLVDPSRPDFDPRYRAALAAEAEGAASRAAAYPSPAQQAANLARSLWDWAVSGFAAAPAAEVDRRLAICRACPQYDEAQARCRLCGCFTQAKIRLRTEKCPEGRW